MTANDMISLPTGGGAVRALGETFAPDPHTGTGRMNVPIELPPGRNGLAPSLALAYSAGNGNGPWGLGWRLDVPGVSRRTAKSIPRYDGSDVFVLSGAEDLVPVPGGTGAQRYRPRVESAFARIEHHVTGTDHWEVRTRDGLVSRYGTPRPAGAGPDWRDPAVVADPTDPTRILTWLLTGTTDSLGNVIGYEYTGDPASPQRYLSRIGYADWVDGSGALRYLAQVRFGYEPRPDRTVDRRGGFPVATTWRCTAIETWTDPGTPQRVRAMRLGYATGANGVSLLTGVQVVGYDGTDTEAMSPLEFGYTGWDPDRRRYIPLRGNGLPDVSLGHPEVDLVDLFGDGLPDVVQLSPGVARYWRNRGGGRLDAPRALRDVPAGAVLGRPGVALADLDGDGRPDLLVDDRYFPVDRDGGFARTGYVRYDRLPPFGLRDPDSRLIDVDGDGVVDLLRTGETAQLVLNRRAAGWLPQPVGTADLTGISLRDSRIRLADMTGDGLTDLVLVTNGRVQYWPNLGYGRFGAPVVMAGAPRVDDPGYGPGGFDERRLLLGDVDGDGCADLVYVGTRGTTVWVNRCGESFGAGTTVAGTPVPDDAAAIRLADMLGTGTAGVLWTYDTRARADAPYKFLDLTGGTKPYLLSTVDNHAGGRTVVEYAPSTRYAAQDAAAGRPWRTTLPFPVQVVSRITTTDAFSGTAASVEYRYHHGYWDGAEREFRGFGRVDQRDATAYDPGSGLAPEQYSPPTETRTWYHQGPVGPEYGGWTELDLTDEYWPGDLNLLGAGDRGTIPAGLDRRVRRDTVRALAGSVLRTELYGPDLDRPFTVAESCYDLVAVTPDATVVAAYRSATRTTQWERGTEPMTRVTFTGGFDGYGRPRTTLDVALPRGWDPAAPAPVADPPLATLTVTGYATRDDPTGYRCDRVASTTRREVRTDGSLSLNALRQAAVADATLPTRLLGLTRTRYDGDAFVGLPSGQLGDHGLPTATETLTLTRGTLGPVAPPYLDEILPSGLRGEYFSDDVLGTSAFTRPDPALDVTWLGGPDPALCQPTFSVRWTGTLTPRFSETYTLRVECAGGARLWLGGQLAIDAWTGTAAPASIALTAGTAYPIRVEYRATGWTAGIRLWWSSPSEPAGVVPASAYGPPAGTVSWPDEYPADFRSTVHSGYTYRTDPEPGYYTVTGTRYDVHDGPGGRGLPTVERDAFGRDTTIGYDGYRLLPVSLTDAAGLTRTAAYDLRVLKPCEVVDANGNHSVAGYTPLGLPAFTATLGHPGTHEADTVEQPGTRYTYGLTAWDDTPGQPAWVHTVRRVDYRWTLVDAENARRAAAGQPVLTDTEIAAMFPPDEPTRFPERFVQSRVYRDGAGRELQSRTQADSTVVDDLGLPSEPGTPAGPLTTHEDPAAVTVSGSRAYDNKGRVVRAWEPTFGSGWAYAVPDPTGLACTATFYDPRGEVVLVVHPDGSQDRTVYGIPVDLTDPDRYVPTPWEAYAYDRNDNAGRTHPDASRGWAGHWNTPSSTVVDALGRTVASVSRLPDAQVVTRSRYDVDGRVAQVTEPLGRVAATHVYDLRGRPWSVTLLDAGTTTTVLDAAGKPLERRDAKGALSLYGYDLLNRPVHAWCRDRDGTPVTLRETTVYGDSPDAGLDRATAATANLLGRPCRIRDEAGSETVAAYDHEGRVLTRTRQFFTPASLLSTVDTPALDPTSYRTDSGYDALGRRTSMTTPVDVTGVRRVVRATFARSGALSTVDVDGTPYVSGIRYNARGQRVAADHGNGIRTRYAYDPATARLVRQHSAAGSGAVYQDQGYGYDLVGNPLTIRDRTTGSGVPGPAPDALDRLFGYDALYRLTSATGREHQTPLPEVWSAAPRGTDVTATQPYTESYDYDLAGNLLRLGHRAGAAGFTRTVTLAPGSDRLGQVATGGATYGYAYDPCGNLVQESTSRYLDWDAANRLVGFRVQPAGSGTPSQSALYRYDSSGTRALKLVRTQNGATELTLYLDGFEVLVLTDAGGTSTRHDELHLTDGATRVATIRLGDPLPGDQRPPVGYHLTDPLGSSVYVLDAAGQPVNREEYSPYGETTFGGYARKRYRYTGRERDEETGLAHHGARYYAPWLARWASCDPAGHADGTNLYRYVRANPMVRVDPHGRAGQAPPLTGKLTTYADAREAANRGCAGWRAANPGVPSEVQAGHLYEAKHAPAAALTEQKLNSEIIGLHSRKGQGLDVTVERPDGEVVTRTRHTFMDRELSPETRNRATDGAGRFDEGVYTDAVEEAKWRIRGTGVSWDEIQAKRNSPVVRYNDVDASGRALPRPAPAVPAPSALTTAGNLAAGITRNVVPGVAEAEIGLGTASMYAYATHHAAAGALLETGARAVPVVGAGAVTGAFVGNAAEQVAAGMGWSAQASYRTGAVAAALSGAGVGALVGSAAGGIGALPGALVGGLAGLGGYYLSKVW